MQRERDEQRRKHKAINPVTKRGSGDTGTAREAEGIKGTHPAAGAPEAL